MWHKTTAEHCHLLPLLPSRLVCLLRQYFRLRAIPQRVAFIHCMGPSGASVGWATPTDSSFRASDGGRSPSTIAQLAPRTVTNRSTRQCQVKRCQPKSLRALMFRDGIILETTLVRAKKHRKVALIGRLGIVSRCLDGRSETKAPEIVPDSAKKCHFSARVRNGPGITSLIELVLAAERQADRSHAGAWEREFSGSPCILSRRLSRALQRTYVYPPCSRAAIHRRANSLH